jgi:hypothetical protein
MARRAHKLSRRLFRRWICFLRQALELFGTAYRGDSSPITYDPVGISAAAMWRIRRVFGQAAAKAGRTHDAISMIRSAEFQKPHPDGRELGVSERVCAGAFGMVSRTVRISQQAAVCRMSRI